MATAILSTCIFPNTSNSSTLPNSTISFSTKPTRYSYPLSNRNATTFKTNNVSFFPAFFTKTTKKDPEAIKQELLEAISTLDRGADASPDDQQRIDEIASKLEAVNPTKQPLKSDLLNGKWELIYTTSVSILQTQRPKFLRSRTNYQAINADILRAQNMESFPFFNQVTADLTPLSTSKVAVKFDYFKIGGLIPVKAPDRARGELDITYLDEEFRVSRGDKGNLFILKMIDPSYRVPVAYLAAKGCDDLVVMVLSAGSALILYFYTVYGPTVLLSDYAVQSFCLGIYLFIDRYKKKDLNDYYAQVLLSISSILVWICRKCWGVEIVDDESEDIRDNVEDLAEQVYGGAQEMATRAMEL